MFSIQAAEPRHVTAVVTLLEEIDRFYGAPTVHAPEQRLAEVKSALFEDRPAASVLLAWGGGRAVGLAAFSFLWPAAGATRSLYLKELFVSKEHRGRGVGRLLVSEVCSVALVNACSRVEWTVDADSDEARGFYQALGAMQHRSKLFYRADGAAIRQLADGGTTGASPSSPDSIRGLIEP